METPAHFTAMRALKEVVNIYHPAERLHWSKCRPEERERHIFNSLERLRQEIYRQPERYVLLIYPASGNFRFTIHYGLPELRKALMRETISIFNKEPGLSRAEMLRILKLLRNVDDGCAGQLGENTQYTIGKLKN